MTDNWQDNSLFGHIDLENPHGKGGERDLDSHGGIKLNEKTVFHLALRREDGAEYAIITGDPGRVEKVAAYLDEPDFVASNREFTTWKGSLEGERVLVTSHGIGGPSTAICVEELSRIGVDTLIRVGTCGGMSLDVCGGDVVIANGAIRQEGTSLEYLPSQFPAVSDYFVTSSLVLAASALERKFHVGVVHCKDSFYGQHSPEDSPVYKKLEYQWQAWISAGCLASEMESATLFAVAAAKGLRAGCVLNVLWNQERVKRGLFDIRSEDSHHAIKVAVEGMRNLILQDK